MSNGYGRSTEGFGISRDASVNLIVKTALENGVTDPRQISYMLATAQHETRNFTAPDEDFGRSQARKLGYGGGEEYFGRGYVHLTHRDNYAKFDRLLGLNGELVRNPALAKDPEIAAKILVVGMRDGLFTGKKLERYVDEDSHDLYNARRVVNGIVPSKAWSVKAAHDCESYAKQWEQRVPGLIAGVRRDGVELPAHDGTPARGTGGATTLRENMKDNAQVRELQAQLSELGYNGRNGKPLSPDGDFGPNTRHAVESFQRAHGLNPVDGIVGPQTRAALADAKDKPLVSERTHADHPLFERVQKDMPGRPDSEVAAAVVAAKSAGLTTTESIAAVQVRDDTAYLAGTTPGFRAQVDLKQPASVLESSRQLEAAQATPAQEPPQMARGGMAV